LYKEQWIICQGINVTSIATGLHIKVKFMSVCTMFFLIKLKWHLYEQYPEKVHHLLPRMRPSFASQVFYKFFFCAHKY